MREATPICVNCGGKGHTKEVCYKGMRDDKRDKTAEHREGRGFWNSNDKAHNGRMGRPKLWQKDKPREDKSNSNTQGENQ